MNQSFGDSLQLQVGPTLQFNKIGTINHIRLTVTDISKAERFYDPLLKFFGYILHQKSDGSRPNLMGQSGCSL